MTEKELKLIKENSGDVTELIITAIAKITENLKKFDERIDTLEANQSALITMNKDSMINQLISEERYELVEDLKKFFKNTEKRESE